MPTILLSYGTFALPGFAIDSVQSHPPALHIEAHPTSEVACCPHCACPSLRVHSAYTRKPRDLPVSDVRVQLILHVRRFFCDVPTCPQRTFAERLPDVLPAHAQRTARLTRSLTVLGFALGGRAGARTARKLALPTSRDTLLRLVRRTPTPATVTPRVLGVDDVALRKGHVYGSILVDLEQHRPIDLLPDRTAETLAVWLGDHPGVEVIARDRSTEYTRGATLGAPTAVQVADRWHILKNQREALERMLNRLHAALSALPMLPSAPGDPAAPPVARRPRALRTPSAREQAAQAATRKRRLQRYQQVQILVAQGVPVLQIATRLAMSRSTATAFAAASAFPERAANRAQPSALDSYLSVLQERWQAGCTNASQLWREIHAHGYPGGRRQVARWVQHQRSAPASTTPKRYGSTPIVPPTEVNPSSAPPLAAPRQLVWLLLRPTAQLTDTDTAALAQLMQHADVVCARRLAHEFQAMVRQRKPESFDGWLQACATSGIPELQSFAKGLAQEYASIRAALSEPWSSGQVEGQVNRLKLLKRQMYGRAKLDLLRQRVLHAA
jgi:transposase